MLTTPEDILQEMIDASNANEQRNWIALQTCDGSHFKVIYDKLRAYRDEIIDECAFIAETHSRENRELAQKMKSNNRLREGSPLAHAAADSASNIMVKIRALKSAEK